MSHGPSSPLEKDFTALSHGSQCCSWKSPVGHSTRLLWRAQGDCGAERSRPSKTCETSGHKTTTRGLSSNVRVKMTSDTRGRRQKEVPQTSSNVCVGSLGIPGKLAHSTPAHAVALAKSVLSCLRRKWTRQHGDRPHTAPSKTRRTAFVMALFCPNCGPSQPNRQYHKRAVAYVHDEPSISHHRPNVDNTVVIAVSNTTLRQRLLCIAQAPRFK